jgi:hypothetical protein
MLMDEIQILDLSEKDFETIQDMLRNTQCEVTFLKVNGDERRLLCTLREEYIKQYEAPKDSPKEPPKEPEAVARKKSDEVISVFDMEINQWRSFRKDSVISVQYPDTYSSIWVRLF